MITAMNEAVDLQSMDEAQMRQMLQHLYGDQRDHRTLYTGAMVMARCQEAGLAVRRAIPYWGPAWAHVLVLAQKPARGAAHGR